MALVKCPECGKEISDKADVCINCGYPINVMTKDNTDITGEIIECFDNFLNNPKVKGNDLNSIYYDVKAKINIQEQQGKLYDKIAETIVSEVGRCHKYCTIITGKNFCELFDFSKLSDDSINKICDILYERINLKETYPDGSNANISFISLGYALYQIIENTSAKNKDKLKIYLREDYFSGKTKYQTILEGLKPILDKNMVTYSVAQAKKKIDMQNGIIHCPKCDSTAITTGQRGFSIVTGFVGSNKTMNRCANCGYRWKPGK